MNNAKIVIDNSQRYISEDRLIKLYVSERRYGNISQWELHLRINRKDNGVREVRIRREWTWIAAVKIRDTWIKRYNLSEVDS